MEKIKRFEKVTEWNDLAIVILISSVIILFLSVAFIWSNWEAAKHNDNLVGFIFVLWFNYEVDKI